MFFSFFQRHTNGLLLTEEASGLAASVVVEADSPKEAIEAAERIGVYFNGLKIARDQGSVHDRWTGPHGGIQFKRNRVRGVDLGPKGKRMCIHFKDGRREWR